MLLNPKILKSSNILFFNIKYFRQSLEIFEMSLLQRN